MRGRLRPAGTARAVVGVLPRLVTSVRRSPPPVRVTLALLCVLAVAFTAASELIGFGLVGASVLGLPLLGAGLLLSRRPARVVFAVVLLCTAYDLVRFGVGHAGVRPGALLVLVVTAGIAYEFSRYREETGLSGASGQGLLVELRQRLLQQGRLPPLPPPWAAEAVVRPAGGGPFAGDFVASAVTGDRRLEVVLVDVSGKGVTAGTRALLLSGAIGGLLGAVPPEQLLPAANDYLERQEWDEGFATAVHVTLDLRDGRFAVVSAGHPPAALFDAGTGRWRLLHGDGPALGLLPDACFAGMTGRLETGDALLLYTDGLVEEPGRDLATGIDRLLGAAERVVTQGFAGGAAALLDRVASGGGDDRGVVLLWKR
jgi:hypothetical protein